MRSQKAQAAERTAAQPLPSDATKSARVHCEQIFMPYVRSGEFQIDDEGRIWRLMVLGNGGLRPCQRRRAENGTGEREYLQIRRVISGQRVHAQAHRVVWCWFNGPIPPGMVINHLNGNKRDNRPSNLEVTTPSGNVEHAWRVLRAMNQDGERNHQAKLTKADVLDIRNRRASGETLQQIACIHGISEQLVSRVARGDRWKHAGGPIVRREVDGYAPDDHLERGSDGRFVGKAAAGRLLDGVLHDEYPEAP